MCLSTSFVMYVLFDAPILSAWTWITPTTATIMAAKIHWILPTPSRSAFALFLVVAILAVWRQETSNREENGI
jgi:hypothetical protein